MEIPVSLTESRRPTGAPVAGSVRLKAGSVKPESVHDCLAESYRCRILRRGGHESVDKRIASPILMASDVPPRRLQSASSLPRAALTSLALRAALLTQLLRLARSSLPGRLAQAWGNRRLRALQGARIGLVDRFAHSIDFLRTNIPEGRAVFLPPEQINETLAHVGRMQVGILLRPVLNCPKSQAIEARRPHFRLAGANTRGRDSKNLAIQCGCANRNGVCQ